MLPRRKECQDYGINALAELNNPQGQECPSTPSYTPETCTCISGGVVINEGVAGCC